MMYTGGSIDWTKQIKEWKERDQRAKVLASFRKAHNKRKKKRKSK